MQQNLSNINVNDLNKLKDQVQKLNEQIISMCSICKNNHKNDLQSAIIKNQVQINHIKNSITQIYHDLKDYNSSNTQIMNSVSLLQQQVNNIKQLVNGDLEANIKVIKQKLDFTSGTVNKLVICYDQLKNNKEKIDTNKNTIIIAVISSIIIGVLTWLGTTTINSIVTNKNAIMHQQVEK